MLFENLEFRQWTDWLLSYILRVFSEAGIVNCCGEMKFKKRRMMDCYQIDIVGSDDKAEIAVICMEWA